MYTSTTNPFRAVKLTVLSMALVATGLAAAGPEKTGSRHPAEGERSLRVDASDLDLFHNEDAEELYRRITSAAVSLCSAETASWDVKRVARRRHCVRAAVERAVARVDEPPLTAVHCGQLDREAPSICRLEVGSIQVSVP